VPVLPRYNNGEVEAMLDCRTCGWARPSRHEDPDS
jgi:hypothetical protein